MTIDVARLAFTYGIALVLIVGGLAILYLTRLDPPESNSQNVALAIVGLMGAATQWVFAKDAASASARSVERATAAGVSAAQSGTGANEPRLS